MIFIQENAFKNDVCNKAAILSDPHVFLILCLSPHSLLTYAWPPSLDSHYHVGGMLFSVTCGSCIRFLGN